MTLTLVRLPATAKADAPPPIPDSIKQASILGQDQLQQIDAAIAAIAKDLADGSNPTSQSADRVWLAGSVADGTGAPGSAAYLSAFAASMNRQLLPVIQAPDANFRAKIQAGLAAAQVANVAQNTELLPLVTALLADPSPAVALEAMKSAHALVPVVLKEAALSPTETQYLDAILAAVAAHPQPPVGGEIVELAYDAFQQPVLGQGGRNPALISKVLIPLVFKLESQRLEIYKDGTPQSPQADSTGLVILFSHDVWLGGNGITPLTADQKTAALTLAADLIGYAAIQASQAVQSNKPTAEIAPLIDALRTDGQELHYFADPNAGIDPDGDLDSGISHLTSLYPSSSAKNIATAGAQAADAIRKFAQK